MPKYFEAKASPYLVITPKPDPAKPAAEKIRFCLYARKSSEEDERQAMSIGSQITEMQSIALRDGLEIAEIRQESHSAKESNTRPVFDKLLQDIRAHVFSGILTWAPDRLSRNAGDLGTLVDLVDQGHLKEIRTHSQSFTTNPNDKFMLMILCSQAKLENDNRGINVKRGQKARASGGYRPCLTPLGYLTERKAGERRSTVIIDPLRGPPVKEIFHLIVEQHMSLRNLVFWARDKANLRTRKGKIVTMSMIQRLVHNHFYTGSFEYPEKSGNWYKGNHEPLISKELFDEAQRVIAQGLKARFGWGYKEFRFVKLMKCGRCGSGITAQERRKVLLDGSMHRYVYYHCSNTHLDCDEPWIREENLIEQLLFVLDHVDLDALGMQQRLKAELFRFERFAKAVLKISLQEHREEMKVDAKTYALYLLTEGTAAEKRELLACLKNKIILQDARIRLAGSENVETSAETFAEPSAITSPPQKEETSEGYNN